MTDEQHEPETESAMPDEALPQTESWQEELPPPHDDFEDQEQAGATAIETEETPVTVNPFEGKAPAKRGKGALLAGVFFVCALFIIGLVYLQIGREAGETSAASTATTPNEAKTAQPQTTTLAPESKTTDLGVTPTTSEADLNALYRPASNQAAGTTGGTTALPVSQAVESKGASALVSPDEVMATAPASSAKTTSNIASTDISDQAFAASQTAFETRLKDLASQVEELKKALEQAIQQTTQLAARLENTQTASSSGASNTVVDIRLEKIEQQIANLTQQIVVKPKPTQEPMTSEAAIDGGSVSPPIVSKEPKGISRQTTKKPQKHKTKKTYATSEAVSQKSKANKWVLRAATPDAAWVSQGADSAELRQVRVGDTLPGIGKVRSIQQTDDRWIIMGSKGSIR